MGRVQELSLAAAFRQAHKGKKVLQDVLSHGPAEGSQCSPLPQTPNRISQAPAAPVQAWGRHSMASEKGRGGFGKSWPRSSCGRKAQEGSAGRAGPGCAAAVRDGSGGMQPAGLKGTGDRMGQGSSHRGRAWPGSGCEPQPTTKAAQQKQRLVRARAARTPNLPQLHCSPSSCKSSCAKSHIRLWTLQ